MAIQVLNQAEINEVAGGDITVGGPGIAIALNPFTLLSGLLSGVFGLVGSVVTSVLGLVTGLLGSVTSLI